jgi:hypothetical protein
MNSSARDEAKRANTRRTATTRSNRSRYRPARPRTRSPHPADPSQSRQDRDDPRAPRTARAVDLVVGEPCNGPIFCDRAGGRLDRHGAARIVRRGARRAGIHKRVGAHTRRRAFTAALDAGVALHDVQEAVSHADPRTTIRYDRARVSLDRRATHIVSTYIAGASRQQQIPAAHSTKRARSSMATLYKVVVCTIAAVVVVVAGCGEELSPNSALPRVVTSLPPQDPTASAAPVGSPTARDGLVSADEAARASELVRSDDNVSELLGRYGGHLTPWEPVELEGESRGAFAMIEFTEPVSMSPTILRPEAVPEPARVEDYVLERVQLVNQTIERFGVFVDLKTMTIVHLAPMAVPPVTVVPPLD